VGARRRIGEERDSQAQLLTELSKLGRRARKDSEESRVLPVLEYLLHLDEVLTARKSGEVAKEVEDDDPAAEIVERDPGSVGILQPERRCRRADHRFSDARMRSTTVSASSGRAGGSPPPSVRSASSVERRLRYTARQISQRAR
jgi:hypothetical protein